MWNHNPWGYLAFQEQQGRLQISLSQLRRLCQLSLWSQDTLELKLSAPGAGPSRRYQQLSLFKKEMYWLCYYSCPISPYFFLSALHTFCPFHSPTPLVQVHGFTYKFFVFSFSYTILILPLSIFYLPFMLLILCTFPPSLPLPLPCW